MEKETNKPYVKAYGTKEFVQACHQGAQRTGISVSSWLRVIIVAELNKLGIKIEEPKE